jgi:hypothetical protein
MNYFDWEYYYNRYPDLEKNKINTLTKCLNHWKTHGLKQYRICNHIFENFDWQFYIQNHSDLQRENINTFEKAIIHYYRHGYKEGRHINNIICDIIDIDSKIIETDNMIMNDIIKTDNMIMNDIIETDNNIMHKIIPDNNSLYSNSDLDAIYDNIDQFSYMISKYKNILFICGDYPNYGGSATNCYMLQKFYKNKGHYTFGIYFNYKDDKNKKYDENDEYHIVDNNLLVNKLMHLHFIPDLCILKSPTNINLRKYLKCKIFYCIGGIYKNSLNDYYYNMKSPTNINMNVINMIKNVDLSFCNCEMTHDYIYNMFKLKTCIFYSTFVPYYRKYVIPDINFNNRKYDYGLIVSDFNRPIKNVTRSINFLKKQQNVILIGKNSTAYKWDGATAIDLVDHDTVLSYYKQIKYIVNDSFYESCSNVLIEALFNGCILNKHKLYVVSSTQYPSYGGAATNAYAIIKYMRSIGCKVAGVFFHMEINDADPDMIGGIFLYKYKITAIHHNIHYIMNDVVNYLGGKPHICLAKNYIAPIFCKEIFNCYTIYLVSGINSLNNLNYPVSDILNNKIKYKFCDIAYETKCNEIVDMIVVNSDITYKLFLTIYPQVKHKMYKHHVDTTSMLNSLSIIDKQTEYIKEYDILICCSNLDRQVKNNVFLINILKNTLFDKYTKCIIGENNLQYQGIINCVYTDLIQQSACINYMQKSKLLLFPSFFDSNSNTVREAYFCKCLPLITKNIGTYELFPDFLICNSFNETEWIEKIIHILTNYDMLKDTIINYGDINDFNKLLNKINILC